MKKNLQDVDKLFKDALDEHLEPAPPGVWDTINSDLDKKQAFQFKEKYFRLKRFALALLLFIFSGVAYLLYFVQPGKNSLITQKNVAVSKNNAGSSADASSGQQVVGENTKHGSKVVGEDAGHSSEITKNNVATTKDNAGSSDVASSGQQVVGEDTKHGSKVVGEDTDHGSENANHGANATNESPVPVATTPSQKTVALTKKTVLSANDREVTMAEKTTTTNGFSHQPNSMKPFNTRSAKRNLLIQNNNPASPVAIAGHAKNHVIKGAARTGNDNYLLGGQYSNATGHTVKGQSVTANENNQQASLLTAYLYQPPLLITPTEYGTPGLVTDLAAGFLSNHIIQNDSLLKAMAVLPKKAPYRHAVSLSVFGSPNHSFTRLVNDDLLAGPGRNKNAAEREEHQGTSYSAGVLVNYGLTKSIILQSGMVFSSAKTIISPKTIYARPGNNGHAEYEFNCSSGYSYITPKTGPAPAVGDSIRAMGSSSVISYIGVPLSLNYVWQRGRFLLKPGIGLSVNFLTSGKSSTRFNSLPGNEKTTSSIAGLKTAYMDGSVALGAEWMVNRKISVGIRPMLRMALTTINKNTPVKTYQNYLSWETGIRINL